MQTLSERAHSPSAAEVTELLDLVHGPLGGAAVALAAQPLFVRPRLTRKPHGALARTPTSSWNP